MTRAKTIEQIAGGPEIDVQRIDFALIDDEPGNPNEMDDAQYNALRENIRDVGFIQPLIVKPDGARFRLVDGHHRRKILAELGYQAAPAVVLDADEAQAKLQLLAINRNRGTPVPIRFAMMLADVAKKLPEDEIRRKLGMKEPEFRDSLRLVQREDDLTTKLRKGLARSSDTALRFTLSPRDAETIEKALTLAVADDIDRGQALALICRSYLDSQQQNKEK